MLYAFMSENGTPSVGNKEVLEVNVTIMKSLEVEIIIIKSLDVEVIIMKS